MLERLQVEYKKIGETAEKYLITLSCNHRCHKDILAIPHQLFYTGLQCKAYKAETHPLAPYPLLFICSNLSPDSCSPEVEAQVLLDEVNKFTQSWPENDSWGAYDLQRIAVITSTRQQVWYDIAIVIYVQSN